jgi:predicted phosphodiesterase
MAMLRRLLLIGDVHGEAERLATALAAFGGEVDAVLCVGDIVDGAADGDVPRCVALLQEHGAIAVRGNHDRWAVGGRPLDPRGCTAEVLAWLALLPATRTLETVAGALLLCHGVDADDMVRLTPDATGYALESNTALQGLLAGGRHRWMVAGHTHQRMVRRFGDLTVINAGTLWREAAPCCAVVDLGAGRVCFHDLVRPGEAPLLEARALP